MDDDRVLKKLETIEEKLHSMDKTLVIQAEQLKEHMRRSLLNEQAVELLASELKPVQAHVAGVNVVIKVTLTLVSIAASIVSILKYGFGLF